MYVRTELCRDKEWMCVWQSSQPLLTDSIIQLCTGYDVTINPHPKTGNRARGLNGPRSLPADLELKRSAQLINTIAIFALWIDLDK